MIKVKLEKIVNDVDNLVALGKLKMPIDISYFLNKIIKFVAIELETHEERRIILVKELGEDKGDKIGFQVKEDNMEVFKKQMKELGSVEVTIPFEPIDIKKLGGIVIEPNLVVDWIFKTE